MKKVLYLIFMLAILPMASLLAHDPTTTDFMRSTGKIYVVLAAVLAIFLGIVIFLIYLDRRLTKLENQTNEHDE